MNNLKTNNRTYSGIDAFRFIAAFAVVGLHVNYDTLNNNIVLFFRLFGRFAVPFFFLVSGFFWNIPDTQKLKKQLGKLLSIILVANLVYLVCKCVSGFSLSAIFDDPTVFINGLSGHLWFLNSLFIGTLFMYFIGFRLNPKLMYLISLFLYLGFLLLFSYKTSYDSFQMALYRSMMSIPFLFVGQQIRLNAGKINNLSVSKLTIITITGFLLQAAEVIVLYKGKGVSPHKIEYAFGTVIYALSMFLLSLKLKMPDQLASLGEKHSLFIYLYHPVIILLFAAVIGSFVPTHLQHYCYWISLPVVFSIVFLVSCLLSLYLPKAFNILNGKLNFISKAKTGA